MNHAVQVLSAKKAFDGRVVLDSVALDVYEGETLVILGGSGSGKSTLLRLMIGNVRADGGDILVKDPSGNPGSPGKRGIPGGPKAAGGRKNLCQMTPDELDAYR